MWCAGQRLPPPCLTDLGQLRRVAALLSKIGGTNRPAGQLGEAARSLREFQSCVHRDVEAPRAYCSHMIRGTPLIQ